MHDCHIDYLSNWQLCVICYAMLPLYSFLSCNLLWSPSMWFEHLESIIQSFRNRYALPSLPWVLVALLWHILPRIPFILHLLFACCHIAFNRIFLGPTISGYVVLLLAIVANTFKTSFLENFLSFFWALSCCVVSWWLLLLSPFLYPRLVNDLLLL